MGLNSSAFRRGVTVTGAMTGTLKARSGMPPLAVTASISIFARQCGALSINRRLLDLKQVIASKHFPFYLVSMQSWTQFCRNRVYERALIN